MKRATVRLAFSIVVAAIACCRADGAKINGATLPPYTGAYQPQGVDERGIWMMADEDERALRDSKFVLHDEALETYVRQVLCNTVGTDRCNGVRIYIVRVPAFNANMSPNGTMQVWTGLLLRVRSEAELGAVLAHEFAHFEERHSLASFKQQRTATDVVAWAGFLGQGAPVIQAAAIGSIFSFSREQEMQADIRSFNYLAASKYRAGAGAGVWDRVMDEADASALGRKQRSRRYDSVAFFATHPTSLERSAYLHDLAAKQGNEGEEDDATYRSALNKWRDRFLEDQLKLNDFSGTEYLLGQLAKEGWTPDLLFARGELYRLRGNPRDLVAAAQFYRQALATGTNEPGVHRSLGLALLRSSAIADGCQELKLYLSMSPGASDAAMIASLIEQSSRPDRHSP